MAQARHGAGCPTSRRDRLSHQSNHSLRIVWFSSDPGPTGTDHSSLPLTPSMGVRASRSPAGFSDHLTERSKAGPVPTLITTSGRAARGPSEPRRRSRRLRPKRDPDTKSGDVTPAVALLRGETARRLRGETATLASTVRNAGHEVLIGINSVDPAARGLSILDQRADCGGTRDGQDVRDYATDRGSRCSGRSGSFVLRDGALGCQLSCQYTWNSGCHRGGSLPCGNTRHRSMFRAPSY